MTQGKYAVGRNYDGTWVIVEIWEVGKVPKGSRSFHGGFDTEEEAVAHMKMKALYHSWDMTRLTRYDYELGQAVA